MPPALSEQRNLYKGATPRPWVRVRLVALDGSVRECDLLADTGNPFEVIVSQRLLTAFSHLSASSSNTNFGWLWGGWLRVAIPDIGFDSLLLGHGSDAVVASARQSSPDFDGLVGLPLLRRMEFGGDCDWFWIRPAGPSPQNQSSVAE